MARFRFVAPATIAVVFSVTSLATAASSVTDYGAGSPVGPLAKVALSQLSVKGRAPMTGYSRDMFGSAWQDLDGNGCDQRDDALWRASLGLS